MKFSEYCDIMQTRGIDKLDFVYRGEEYFLLEDDGFNFLERIERRREEYIEENGIELWSNCLTKKQSFLYRFVFVIIGALIFFVLFQIFPILGLANWYFEALIGGAALLAIIIATVAMLSSPVIIEYIVTSKRIITVNGIVCQTAYDNIRRVTMRKYRLKKGYGRIQIYVKKGLSINFRMIQIPDVEKVYQLILDNLTNTRNSQNVN